MKRKALVTLALLACFAPVRAFIPVPFEVVAQLAPTVLVGKCELGAARQCHFQVVEVIKSNRLTPQVVTIKPISQFYFEPQDGQLYLVALNKDDQPYDAGSDCGTINILGVGRNYLYTEEYWPNEDYQPMTLEEMKERLLNPEMAPTEPSSENEPVLESNEAG